MKNIQLTKGFVAIVDDEDYEFLSQWKWCYHANGYAIRNYKGRSIQMHRVVNHTPAGFQTDHINMDKLDNRKCNLRSVTRGENNQNRPAARNSTSKYKGVHFSNRDGVWIGQFKPVGEKCIRLGTFNSELAAAMAYDAMAKSLGAKTARLNMEA